MEIRLDKVKYNDIINNLSLTFNSNQIVALLSKNSLISTSIVNLISGLVPINDGIIKVGTKVINNKTKIDKLNLIKNNTSYLYEDYDNMLFNINILEDIKYINNKINLSKVKELLKIFDLDETILYKNYQEISTSEKKKILLISIIIKNNKVTILNNPTSSLDNKATQTLIKILKKFKRENKIIIILSENSDFLLQVIDRVILVDDKNVIADGAKYKILSNKVLMQSVNMEVPKVINFENRVYELKKIKLGYRDNINDLIKDIYRHVK